MLESALESIAEELECSVEDLLEYKLDEALRSTVDRDGNHTPGLIRKAIGALGGKRISPANAGRQVDAMKNKDDMAKRTRQNLAQDIKNKTNARQQADTAGKDAVKNIRKTDASKDKGRPSRYQQDPRVRYSHEDRMDFDG